MMEVASGDKCSYKTCKAPVKSSPTNQHRTFYSPDALHVAQSQAVKGKLGNLSIVGILGLISWVDTEGLSVSSLNCNR